MKKVTYQIYSLGCKVNQYDGAVLARLLDESGFVKGVSPSLIVINTCSVTQRAITKDRQLTNELKRKFPFAKFLIMGCWPQTDKEIAIKLPDENFIFWGVGELEKLSLKLKECFKENLAAVNNRRLMVSGLLALTDRSRYFLKIADGCNQFCAYCIIPFARGRLKSRQVDEIIKEAEAAIKAGYREIVLSGIHLGRYGQDLNLKKINLVFLLRKILKLENLGRLRLSSIEVNEVSDELINLIIKNKKICRHLHISLQSGSDKILKLMKRPYSKKYFLNKVKKIRKKLPEIAISTDIIVGFPGESDQDFKDTYQFAKECSFSKIHVFSFSAHKLTAAYNLSPKVSSFLIKKRSQELRKLSNQLENIYQQQIFAIYKDKPLKLIKEQSSLVGQIRAKTEFGFDLKLSSQEAQKHQFL